ncbi:MAG: hypothetical protein V1929_02365 [bacterium]
MKENWTKKLSLVSRGARDQIAVAIALMAVLPLLVVCFLALTMSFPAGTYSFATKVVLGILAFALAASGYGILRQYPANIMKLRHYLRQIAEGQLPDKITLLDSEDDIKAIQTDLNTVVDELRRKVDLLEEQLRVTREMGAAIESQQNELLEAERHRVMIQSVGAACHHIGQPTTVLRAHLHVLKKQASSPKELEEIDECAKAVDSIADVLGKLRHISEYRTVPYRTFYAGEKRGEDGAILDIEH